MTRANIIRWIASSALLTVLSCLPLECSAYDLAFFEIYSGTNKCTLTTNRDGEQWAEMWCQGTYRIGGTCNGAPLPSSMKPQGINTIVPGTRLKKFSRSLSTMS